MKDICVILLTDDTTRARSWAVSKFGNSKTPFNKGTWYNNGQAFYFTERKDATLFVSEWNATIQ